MERWREDEEEGERRTRGREIDEDAQEADRWTGEEGKEGKMK